MDGNPFVQAGIDAGLDPTLASYMPRYVQVESGGDPNAQTGSYSGLLQQGPDEIAKYGSGLAGGARMYAARQNWFKDTFGRLPSPTELYLASQQGEGGLSAHLGNPNAPAWMNMFSTAEGQKKGIGWAQKAIWGNVPDNLKPLFGNVNNVSSQNFLNLWQHKIEGAPLQRGNAPMADYNRPPALSPEAMQGNQPVLFGGNPTLAGAFGGLGRMLGIGTEDELGRRLQNAGAALIAVGNPAGGAALQNAANMPLFRQRFTPITDSYGRNYLLNNRSGQTFDLSGRPVGGPIVNRQGVAVGAPQAPVQQVGGVPTAAAQAVGAPGGAPAPSPYDDQAAADAAKMPVSPQDAALLGYATGTPVGQKADLDAKINASVKQKQALEEAATQAQTLKSLVQRQIELASNPEVVQGALAEPRLMGAKTLSYATGGRYGYDKASLTDEFDANNNQLVALSKGILGNVPQLRGPEIQFIQSTKPSKENQMDANLALYHHLGAMADRTLYAAALARHLPVLTSSYYDTVAKYNANQNAYADTQGARPGAKYTRQGNVDPMQFYKGK